MLVRMTGTFDPDDELMTIGQFSALARISVRMLRHYDEHGVLAPACIEANGIGGTPAISWTGPCGSDSFETSDSACPPSPRCSPPRAHPPTRRPWPCNVRFWSVTFASVSSDSP